MNDPDPRADHGRAWEPLLTGSARDRALAAVEDIAAALASAPSTSDAGAVDATLGGGTAGIALLYAYLAEALGDARHHESAAFLLDSAIDALASTPLDASLLDGFTGVAWAVAHINARRARDGALDAEPEPDGNDDVDAVLADVLAHPQWGGAYDLGRGLVGIGVYALERLPRPAAVVILERVVAHLDETAVAHDDGVGWLSGPPLPPVEVEYRNGVYNLGVAHGTPGVIALLAQAAAAGVAISDAQRLLDSAMSWLLAHRMGPDDLSIFPRWLAPDLGSPAPARPTWCYGDPGVASTLFLAAGGAGRRDWEHAALEAARRAARRPVETCGIVDASICHGTAGLAHMFNRLHQRTGVEELRGAAQAWFDRTLDRLPDASWDDSGFLVGPAGVALALLAAATDVEPEWDRSLLLSSRFVG